MNVLDYFEKSVEDKIIVYKLKNKDRDTFIDLFSDSYVDFFISKEDLKQQCETVNECAGDYLRDIIIPDQGNIKAGDFGEIFCYLSVLNNETKKGFTLEGPKKWLWKEEKNKPAPYSDVVLFYQNNSDSSLDKIIVVESKTAGSRTKKNRLQDAVDGANEDMGKGKGGKSSDKDDYQYSRLLKTLIWLKAKYSKLQDKENRDKIIRFLKPEEYGSFKKIFKAMVLIDSNFFDEQSSNTTENDDDISIILFDINDFIDLYEQIRTKALLKAG